MHHELAKSSRQAERCQVVYALQDRQKFGGYQKRQTPHSTTEKNPALSCKSLPDTELQDRSKKEFILPKNSSWLECAPTRHYWSRVPGRIQSPGDKVELLIRTRRKFLIVHIGILIYLWQTSLLDKLLAARSAQHSGRTVPFSMCLKHSIIFRKLKEAIIGRSRRQCCSDQVQSNVQWHPLT